MQIRSQISSSGDGSGGNSDNDDNDAGLASKRGSPLVMQARN